MTRILLSTAIAVSALFFTSPHFTADAQARPSTKNFTCEGARQFIRQRGAVVMNHKSPRLYRRFVDNRNQCFDHTDRLERFYVPTRSGQCALRICSQRFRVFD